MEKRKKQSHGYQKDRYTRGRGSDSLNWRDTPSKSFPSPPMFHGPLPTHHPPYQQQQQFSQKEYFPDHIEQALFLHERWMEIDHKRTESYLSTAHRDNTQ